MIIYNFHALLVALVAILISLGLNSVNANYGTLGMPEFWSIILLVSCLITGTGLKPRLYLIPLWLFSFLIFVWRSYAIYDMTGLLYSTILGVFFIAVGVTLRLSFVKRNWDKSKDLLVEFKNSNSTNNPELLMYYPNYIYADNPLAEKYLEIMFKFLQSNWFGRKEVSEHYLAIIEKLNQLDSSEAKVEENAYLKKLLEDNQTNKISEYLLTNLKKKL